MASKKKSEDQTMLKDNRSEAGGHLYSTTYRGNNEAWKGIVHFIIGGIYVQFDEDELLGMYNAARAAGPKVDNTIDSIMRNEG